MSLPSGCRRAATALLCALGAGLASAAPAHAGAADQTWNCRASAAYIAIPAQDRTEPVVANGSSRTSVESPDRGRCADDEGQPVGPGNELGLEGPVAKTNVNPDAGLAVDQSVGANASVVDFAPGQAGNNLVVRGARAEASASCTANGPALNGSSFVPLVTIGGRTLDITPVEQVVERLPTGAIVKIRFNEQTRSGNTLIQRAVHLEVQDPAGRIVKDVVVAEAKVTGGSEVCDRAAQEETAANGGGANGGGSGGSGDANQPCITGAEYIAEENLCVITRERDGNLSNGRERVSVVGKPFEGPSGGSVLLPAEAPKSARKSTCLKRKGVKFLVVGTRKNDRITGSNRSDVIFGLGGNDQLSGGRGNDCLVGGRGGDNLSGAQGRDTLVGNGGGDNLNGGSQGDRLLGGAGNDAINAAFGNDRVKAGKGKDAVNVATSGPAARVRCGKGRDVVRFNTNERRRVKGCERRYSIR